MRTTAFNMGRLSTGISGSRKQQAVEEDAHRALQILAHFIVLFNCWFRFSRILSDVPVHILLACSWTQMGKSVFWFLCKGATFIIFTFRSLDWLGLRPFSCQETKKDEGVVVGYEKEKASPLPMSVEVGETWGHGFTACRLSFIIVPGSVDIRRYMRHSLLHKFCIRSAWFALLQFLSSLLSLSCDFFLSPFFLLSSFVSSLNAIFMFIWPSQANRQFLFPSLF